METETKQKRDNKLYNRTFYSSNKLFGPRKRACFFYENPNRIHTEFTFITP